MADTPTIQLPPAPDKNPISLAEARKLSKGLPRLPRETVDDHGDKASARKEGRRLSAVQSVLSDSSQEARRIMTQSDVRTAALYLREGFRKARRQYHASLHAFVGYACEVAENIFADAQRVTDLVELWEEQKRPSRPSDAFEALHLLLQFGADNDKRASEYFTAAKCLIEDGVSPREIPGELKRRHGFRAVIQQSKRRRQQLASHGIADKAGPVKSSSAAAKPLPEVVTTYLAAVTRRIAETSGEVLLEGTVGRPKSGKLTVKIIGVSPDTK